MPIYEYACHDCRKVFQFYSKTLSIQREPHCPVCGKGELERLLSSFCLVKGGGKKEVNMEGFGGQEETHMQDPFSRLSPSQRAAAEKEVYQLLGHAESLGEENPRELGHVIEKLTQLTGFSDAELDVAIARLKSGDDLEKIEADMGENEDSGMGGAGGGVGGYDYDGGMYDF